MARDILVRTHQGEKQVNHGALLPYTERLARERGWNTVLAPQVKCIGFHPDLWIDTGDWSIYVEIESRYRAHSNQWYKWKATLRAQGFAAIIGRTEVLRDLLIGGCKSAGMPGIAADLETLRLRDGDWWQKAWRAAHGSLETIEFLQGLTHV